MQFSFFRMIRSSDCPSPDAVIRASPQPRGNILLGHATLKINQVGSSTNVWGEAVAWREVAILISGRRLYRKFDILLLRIRSVEKPERASFDAQKNHPCGSGGGEWRSSQPVRSPQFSADDLRRRGTVLARRVPGTTPDAARRVLAIH
jgi:hypothetical protein